MLNPEITEKPEEVEVAPAAEAMPELPAEAGTEAVAAAETEPEAVAGTEEGAEAEAVAEPGERAEAEGEVATEAEAEIETVAEAVSGMGPLLVVERDPAASPPRDSQPTLHVNLHDTLHPSAPSDWHPTPGCSCLMCSELTDEQRARLEAQGELWSHPCPGCGEEVQGRARFRRHLAQCCGDGKKKPQKRRKPIIHECSTCLMTFPSARLRNEHYASSGHEKRSPCPVCHKYFHPDFLRIHLSSHSGAFYCRICDTHFSSKATLKTHMYRHSGLKPHKCDECPATFRTPSSLFMHKRYHHTDDRPYACNMCPKRFAARSTLMIHLRQHTGERPFACKLCPKSYTRRSSLTQHLRTHTQERRHACMTCGKRFDNKSYMKVHMNRHLGIRAHTCARCGRGFFSRPNLLKHMQVLCFKHDYDRPAAEQEARTQEIRAATQRQLEAAERQVQEAVAGEGEGAGEEGEDDIQTTEVILSIESIPEDGELLVGHLVQ